MGENIAFGYLQFWRIWHFYHPQRSCGKVIFSQACVKNSVGGVSASVHAGIHPLGQTPPGQTHPLGRHHPQADTPQPVHAGIHTSACWDTHPSLPIVCWDRHGYCCGRYASYWNAFLLSFNLCQILFCRCDILLCHYNN